MSPRGVFGAIIVLLWLGAVALTAQSRRAISTPACVAHYILLGHVPGRAYIEVTVPPDGVCVLDVRRQLARRPT